MAAPSYSMSRRGSALPAVLVVIILCVIGFFGWKAYESRQAAKRAQQEEYRRKLAERDRLLFAGVSETNEVKKAEVVVEAPPIELPPEPPKKSEAEILREEEAHRKAVWAQIGRASPAFGSASRSRRARP